MEDAKEVEDPLSVSSPRRTLSFSKNNKRATVAFPYDKASVGFGVSGEHGFKPLEVYGAVRSISTVVVTESWMHALWIFFYYPSRYWALAVPLYLMVTIVLGIVFYIGLNFMATPPPTSFCTMLDDFPREPLNVLPLADGDEQPIEPISDIRIGQIISMMFNSFK